MDMDMLSAMGMSGGMDMASSGLFKDTNMAIARKFWLAIAAVVCVLGLRRCLDSSRARWRKRAAIRLRSATIATPGNALSQAYDTLIAIGRELAYAQPLLLRGRLSRFIAFPSLGRILLLTIYCVVILIMLWSNVLLTPDSSIYAYRWEIVGFRAAWVSVAQVPLIYGLAGKINIVSLLSGISYERLNWLHRWTARILFLTIIVHWSFFFQEWVLADFVSFELAMMPMVKYGFAAWGVLGWMVLSSFGYLRSAQYEIFLLQHLVSAGAFLVLLYLHIPAYARYNIWLTIGFVAFDRVARALWFLGSNLHLLQWSKRSSFSIGFPAQLKARSGGFIEVTIQNVDMRWKPGQHVYLSIPSVEWTGSHPFTIANDASAAGNATPQVMRLYIKAHGGFTRRLQDAAEKKADLGAVRSLLSGPWGRPPSIEAYETVVLLACSSGISFTLPFLESIARKPYCVRQLFFHWIVRDEEQLSCFTEPLLSAISAAEDAGIAVTSGCHVTGATALPIPDQGASSSKCQCSPSPRADTTSSVPESITSSSTTVLAVEATKEAPSPAMCPPASCCCSAPTLCITHGCRPLLDSLLQPAVETAHGEMAVLACGGRSFAADLSAYISRLSDERAVHKGTGAQGIFLFTETYGLG